jgi:hypothetical protein
VRILTLVAASVFFVFGVLCCLRGKGRRKDEQELVFGISMGIALITSGFLAFVVLLLQGVVEDAANDEQVERDAKANREQLEATAALEISVTASISGFNPENLPPGVKLDEINFAGKVLDTAQLAGANLADFNFQDAVLTRANLEGADLSRAILLGVDLTDSELSGANLERADLRSARFEHAAIESAKSLKYAKVNSATCWPQAFLETSPLAIGLIAEDGTVSTAPPRAGGEFGQACTKEPTKVVLTTVTAEVDGSFDAVPPVPDARIQRIDWVTTPGGPGAYVTWIVE